MNSASLRALLPLSAVALIASGPAAGEEPSWFDLPPGRWPPIVMVNEITYTDGHHPVAGCSFLIVAGGDTLAVTAKHILTYFKSEAMRGVDFVGTLEEWKAYPKDRPGDAVIFDRLLNPDAKEAIKKVPAGRDWLLFTVNVRSPEIQPLTLRETPLEPGEPVYIVGWRYSDRDCPQIVYPGTYEESENGTVLLSCEKLADNTMPGLSGAPVIDAAGRVIGLMSKKAGKRQRASSVDYPLRVLEALSPR